MSWNYIKQLMKYNNNDYTDDITLNECINQTVIEVDETKQFDIDDDRSTLSVNTPEPIIEEKCNRDMCVSDNLKKLCILYKIKKINQDFDFSNEYIKNHYGNISHVVKPLVEYPTNQLEIIEIKLMVVSLYCLGLTTLLMLSK